MLPSLLHEHTHTREHMHARRTRRTVSTNRQEAHRQAYSAEGNLLLPNGIGVGCRGACERAHDITPQGAHEIALTNGRARPDVVAPARRSRRAGAWGAHLGSSDQDCHASLIPEEQRASSSVTAAAAPEFCAHPVGDRLGVIPDLRKPCEDAESTTAHSRGRFT